MTLFGLSPKVMALFLTLSLNAAFPNASARLKMTVVCPSSVHGLCEPVLTPLFLPVRHTLFLA